LIVAPAAFAGGGVATLVLASRITALGGTAGGVRILGVTALVFALLSGLVNYLAFLSWSLCF
jgi:hypothetical protein